MYARKLRVDIVIDGERRPCPLDWLDNFCMRSFTGEAQFDDTLPTGEGTIEAGFRVSLPELAEAMAAWFIKRGKGGDHLIRVDIRPA
jgi:hypothetical protein